MSLTANSNTQNLFFKSEKKRDFSDVLNEVQSYISSKYSALVIDGINNVNSENDEVKRQVKRYIGKYLLDYRISVEGLSQAELVDKLYTEMAEFSFLTKYIFGTGIEEININSWDDIEVQYSSGTSVKLDEKFESPEHAINVVRRMLHVSGMVLDNTSPAILGHLSKNIRIAVLKTPLVDEDVGVAASIRIVNAQKLKKEDFIKSGTATDEMMELLSAQSAAPDFHDAHPTARMLDDRYNVTESERRKIIATYFDETGALKECPAREKKKIVVLEVIAQNFQPGRSYPEKEVNRILERIHPDHAYIRRLLIEYGFLERTRSGSEYWRAGTAPEG